MEKLKKMSIKATVHKYGDHIDTDVILPGRYLDRRTETELAPYCLSGIDPEFVSRVKPGDVIVAGKNFGTGSSREHAPVSIKANGIACIIAESYARIFYRNAINIGLPVFICPNLVAAVRSKDEIDIDIQHGCIVLNGQSYQAEPLAPVVLELLNAGGLVPFVRKSLTKPRL